MGWFRNINDLAFQITGENEFSENIFFLNQYGYLSKNIL
jgi:hypothetical protein